MYELILFEDAPVNSVDLQGPTAICGHLHDHLPLLLCGGEKWAKTPAAHREEYLTMLNLSVPSQPPVSARWLPNLQ